jgi:hypothetical protein
MQQLIRLKNPYNVDIGIFNKDYLDKGWRVVNMVIIESNTLIILVEKETRKDKLDHLNDLTQDVAK